jgi:hypothetical protein
VSVPAPPPTSRRIAGYVAAAVRGEVRKVECAEHGERHIAIYAAAAALGVARR